MASILKFVGLFVAIMAGMILLCTAEYRLGLFASPGSEADSRVMTIVNDTDFFIQFYLDDGGRTRLMVAQMDAGRKGSTVWSIKDTRTYKAYTTAGQLLFCKQISWDEMERTGWTLTVKGGDSSCQ